MSSRRSRKGGSSIWKYIKPIEQVFPKSSLRYRLGEMTVGRGDDPHIDLDRSPAAQPFEFTFLQYAKELGLQFERQLTYFIEENGRTVGDLKATRLPRDRTSKGALLPPKQLGFDQGGGQRRAIDLDHRAVFSCARIVNGLRKDLLAGAGLAEQENRRIGFCDLPDFLDDRLKPR